MLTKFIKAVGGRQEGLLQTHQEPLPWIPITGISIAARLLIRWQSGRTEEIHMGSIAGRLTAGGSVSHAQKRAFPFTP